MLLFWGKSFTVSKSYFVSMFYNLKEVAPKGNSPGLVIPVYFENKG